MTLKNSSDKSFLAMFKQSMKQVCVFPIIAFICGFIYAANDLYTEILFFRRVGRPEFSGFFYDDIHSIGILADIIAIIFAVLSALMLFSFQWSKKQCNVIYSLGMKREQIYTAKMLGGIVPMTGAAFSLALIETVVNVCAGYALDGRYWKIVIYTVFSYLSVYVLAFVLSAVVFANTGNVIEGLGFTAILSVFTMVLDDFFNLTAEGYTLGFDGQLPNLWNWSVPFLQDAPQFSGASDDIVLGLGSYFNISDERPELYFKDYTALISALVYAAVIVVIGYLAFKKHKNEIAGSWGRAKGMTEITGAVLGFYAFTFVLEVFGNPVDGNDNIFMFIGCCIAFIAAELVFKLIFSSRRKAALKQTFSRFPAYGAVLGAVTLVFAFGLFGYSSRIPDPSEVSCVAVDSDLYKYADDRYSGTAYYALTRMNLIDCNDFSCLSVTYSDKAEIGEIVKLHKAIVTDGKIKNSAKNACANPIRFTYYLKNGKTLIRYYTESTDETVRMMLLLNDFEAAKKKLKKSMPSGGEKPDVSKYLSDYFGTEVIVTEGYEILDKRNGRALGEICYKASTDSPYVSVYDTGECFALDIVTGSLCYAGRMEYLTENDCYLFPKDMTKGFNIGLADEELINALCTDIVNQSAADYFFHRAEDEIGVLSFGLSFDIISIGEDIIDYALTVDGVNRYYDSNGNEITPEENVVGEGQYASKQAWNIASSDIRAIVVTKDMKNTVRYLEEHDLMKYFEASRKTGDIKAVKVATPIELYDSKHNTYNLPLFCAGYWSDEADKKWNQSENPYDDVYFAHYFNKISNQITDANTIKKLVDSSVLFGFCGNDYRIMEIEYYDGSLATMLIPAESYKSIMG